MSRLTGKCLCGKVRYSVEDKFEYFFYCHCKQCQESTGSAFNAAAGVFQDSFKVTAGEESLTSYNKTNVDSSVSVVKFCKICGSSLFSIKARSEGTIVQIRMGTLIDAPTVGNPKVVGTEARPQGHVWVSENAPWFQIKEENPLPQYPKAAVPPPAPGPLYPPVPK
jgi:hypothetical protein